jgi:hypothetical protein
MEEMYNSKTAAMNLVHELCKLRPRGNLDTFIELCVSTMNDFQARSPTLTLPPGSPSLCHAHAMCASVADARLHCLLPAGPGHAACLSARSCSCSACVCALAAAPPRACPALPRSTQAMAALRVCSHGAAALVQHARTLCSEQAQRAAPRPSCAV